MGRDRTKQWMEPPLLEVTTCMSRMNNDEKHRRYYYLYSAQVKWVQLTYRQAYPAAAEVKGLVALKDVL